MRRLRLWAAGIAIASAVIGLTACGGGDEPSATTGATTTTAPAQFPLADPARHAACVATARAIEAAAAIYYAQSGSYGTVDDLVAKRFLRTPPDPSWGLVIGPDGTVDDSTCPYP